MSPPSVEVLRDARLPSRVRDLSKPPEALYLHGELPRGPCVALVGTRHPSADGQIYARHLAGCLARAGVAVLSGGAEGIDTAAHEGALDVGGVSVVVAPSGFERPFPESNRDLFRRVVELGGAFVSEHAPDVHATRASFFPRNALLVALAHLVVVVEAPWRSGAGNAAKCARQLGRPLFMVPHAPWNSRGGCWSVEISRGASLCLGADDLLRRLEAANLHPLPRVGAPAAAPAPLPAPAREEDSGDRGGATPPAPPPFHPDPELRAVLEARSAGATHVDEIARRTGLSVGRIQYALLTLTLQGVLVAAPQTRGAKATRRKH